MFSIKGDVQDIERSNGKTEVLIDEGSTISYLSLNEPLIAFSSAVEEGKLEKAADILEGEPSGEETDAMWVSLSNLALKAK